MSTGDDVLAQRACEGDQQAFIELYNKYENDIYRFAYYLSGEASFASDLFQETWYRVANHFCQGKPVRNFRIWIFTIARNVFIDELRKRKFRRFFLGNAAYQREGNLEDHFEAEPSIEEEFEFNDAMNMALDTLAEKQRSAFLLCYVSGLSTKEAAQVLHIAEGTVKATLFKAVRKMREALKDFQFTR